MKKMLLVVITVLFVSAVLNAEEAKWKLKGMLGASYNSTSVTENWSGPEKNSQNWGVKLDASAEKDEAKTNWLNTLKEEYGRTKISGSEEQTSADRIEFNSVYTRKLSFYVNPYAGLSVLTQNWLWGDPVTYTESLGNGVWLVNTPKQQLKTRAGVAFQQLRDTPKYKTLPSGLIALYSSADDPATLEIEETKTTTGGEWITNYELLIKNDVKFTSEAKVFSAFKGGANLRWDNSLYVKLTSIVTMQMNYLAVYNYDNLPHPVWPQDVEKRLTISFGLSYNLF
jgi:hypothetical protein